MVLTTRLRSISSFISILVDKYTSLGNNSPLYLNNNKSFKPLNWFFVLKSLVTNASTLNDTKNSDSKVLVVYFSKNGENYNVGNVSIGNTAMMASYIKEYLGADSFEIVPVKNIIESLSKV